MKNKKYSPAYWCKQKLGFCSQPEKEILAAVHRFATEAEDADIAFDGTPIALLNTLYIEHKKRSQVYWCLFPTPLDVAFDLCDLARVGDGDTVFDPGCGLGNLLYVAQKRGAKAFGVDFQHWLPEAGVITGTKIERGDYLNGYQPGDFSVVLTNPPFGKIGESSDATADFLNRIADQCTTQRRIAAILPRAFLDSQRPARRREIIQRFDVLRREPLPPDTFKPLTGVSTEMVLLQVTDADEKRRVEAVLSQPKPKKQTLGEIIEAACTPRFNDLPLFRKLK